ncbi:hypothetical protein [Marinicella litoralis]|uniref:hypothetical protein n=1 Tax=Marinicella litoralis TaxID=644220 RepID=UPI000BFED3AD|nr:hypothetical protein [Marinicella litoralis]
MSFDSENSTAVEPKNIIFLLKVEPNYFYYSNNKFHAIVAGQLKLEIKTETILPNLINYDALVIDGLDLDLNSNISLNWVADEKKHQIPLNSNTQSINLIDFQTAQPQNISDLHLLIRSNFELGDHPNAHKEVSFESIYFDSRKNHSTLSLQMNEWFDYTPLKFNSINGYTSSENLHFQSLIQRLVIWVLINVLLYWLLRVSGKQLIISLTIAWCFTLIPFVNNFIKQNQQIETAFAEDGGYLNKQDISTYELAQDIIADLKNRSDINLSTQKFIIVGTNSFYHLRLFHHLMGLNVAINNYINNDLPNDGTKPYIYILTKKSLEDCHANEGSPSLPINILSQQAQYCLVSRS